MQVVDNVLLSGSGTTVQDINKFIKSFEMTQKMMKKILNGLDTNALKNMKF